jgi:hypothetical protein
MTLDDTRARNVMADPRETMIPERNVGIVNLRAHRAKHLSLVDGDIEINTADVKSANLRHEAGYQGLPVLAGSRHSQPEIWVRPRGSTA